MGSDPKRHHFVPRLLLRQFASPPEDAGRLFVFDRLQKCRFESSPLKTFASKHFYRTDPELHSSGDDLVVERYLADLESRIAPIIQKLLGHQPSAGLASSLDLLHFVAAQLLRSPAWHSWMEGMHLEMLETILTAYCRNKAARRRWRQRIQGIPGADAFEDPSVMLSRLKSGDFTVRTDANWKIALSLEITPLMMDALASRHWQLMVLPESAPELALPDSGVSLVPLETGEVRVGLLEPNTAIVLPVSPRRALVASDPRVRLDLRRPGRWARHLNSAAFAASERQLICSTDDFEFHLQSGEATSWSKWLTEGGAAPELVDKRRKLDEFTARDGPTEPN